MKMAGVASLAGLPIYFNEIKIMLSTYIVLFKLASNTDSVSLFFF